MFHLIFIALQNVGVISAAPCRCKYAQYLLRLQYTLIRKLKYECTSTGRRNMVLPRSTWKGPVPIKKEQLWNGFCPVAVADDDGDKNDRNTLRTGDADLRF